MIAAKKELIHRKRAALGFVPPWIRPPWIRPPEQKLWIRPTIQKPWIRPLWIRPLGQKLWIRPTKLIINLLFFFPLCFWKGTDLFFVLSIFFVL